MNMDAYAEGDGRRRRGSAGDMDAYAEGDGAEEAVEYASDARKVSVYMRCICEVVLKRRRYGRCACMSASDGASRRCVCMSRLYGTSCRVWVCNMDT